MGVRIVSDKAREDLLSNLRKITFAAYMSVLPSEMCLEIETITPTGLGHQWIGYDDWNVFKLKKCEHDKWHNIIKNISERTLEKRDIEGTDLENAVDYVINASNESASLSLLLAGLCKYRLPPLSSDFYALFDGETFCFFAQKEELRLSLQKKYHSVDTLWEEMDNSSLSYWWNRYNIDGDGLPVITFENT